MTPLKGERTRAQILDGAYQVFLNHGYNGASMRQLAQAAGLTLGGMYAHFSGKEEIFLAVLEHYNPYRSMLAGMQTAQGDSLETFVRSLAARLLGAMSADPDALKLIFIEIVEFQGIHFQPLGAKLIPGMFAVFQNFARFESELRPLPPPVLARSFIGLFFSFYMTSTLLGPTFTNDPAALEQFIEIYLRGILKRDPTPIGA